MLKTKCFIIGGIILSSLLQAKGAGLLTQQEIQEIAWGTRKASEASSEDASDLKSEIEEIKKQLKKQDNEIELLERKVVAANEMIIKLDKVVESLIIESIHYKTK